MLNGLFESLFFLQHIVDGIARLREWWTQPERQLESSDDSIQEKELESPTKTSEKVRITIETDSETLSKEQLCIQISETANADAVAQIDPSSPLPPPPPPPKRLERKDELSD